MEIRTKEWLIEQRVKQGLTQNQLANKIGMSIHTIENIEQGKRLGSVETWEKITNFFTNVEEVKLSYDCEEIIEELKEDIEEFGEDENCILIYKVEDNHIVFTNYDFITKDDPLNPSEELDDGENFIETNLKYALEVFENQNEIL